VRIVRDDGSTYAGVVLVLIFLHGQSVKTDLHQGSPLVKYLSGWYVRTHMNDIFICFKQWDFKTEAPTPEARLDRTSNWLLLSFREKDKVKLPNARTSQALEVTSVKLLENDDCRARRGK
jgi:hypothetical protein